MLRNIALIFFLGLFFQISFAQTSTAREPKTPEEKATALTARLTKRLNLNADQSEKVKAIQLDRFQKMESVKAHQNVGEKRGAARGEAKTVLAETDGKMKEVLTAEQYTQYEQQRQEQVEKHRQRVQNQRKAN